MYPPSEDGQAIVIVSTHGDCGSDIQVWVKKICLKKKVSKEIEISSKVTHKKMESRNEFDSITPLLSKENRHEVWQIFFFNLLERGKSAVKGFVGPHQDQ